LVHSAALRQVRSPQLAEEVVQSVFADLARGAGKLRPDTIVTAWLYAVTRRTAIDAIRKESRRQLREQIAVEMTNMNATSADWTQIEPLLDDAMAALDETDRSAILLRYFENKNLREVGEALGASEDAAQKRVSRAVERLREFFSKRNVTIGASGLAVLISANAVQSAPIGLAATISAAAVLAGTAVHTSTLIAATKAIAMTTLQKTLVTATVAILAGAGIYEARQASQLGVQVQTLQQQQTPLADQIRQLQRERDDATNRLAGLLAENEQLKSNPNETELLKLRGEVGVLRQEAAKFNKPVSQPTVQTTQASQPADPIEQTRRMGREKAIDGRNLATAFIEFAAHNQSWLPTNWQQVTNYLKDYPVSGTNDFEMIYSQPINRSDLGTNMERTALVREYLAWPTPDGRWGKIYGFADGHSQVVILKDGNFSAWEKENTFNPQSDSK
jgi:RNA polymerase sigma factor (sigma-70 family)